MTFFLCWIAWMYAVFSDRNKSTGLAVVCFLAMVAAMIDA